MIYLATGRTRVWSLFSVAYVVLSIPGSILVLWVLHLGALGLAIKLAALSAVLTLIQDWYACRSYGWKTDNLFRLATATALFSIGGLSYGLVRFIAVGVPPIIQIAASLSVYAALVGPLTLYAAHRFGYWRRLRQLYGLS